MHPSSSNNAGLRLGDLLVRAGYVTQEQVDIALHAAAEQGCRLGTALVRLGYLDQATLGRALGKLRRIRWLEPAELEHIDPELVRKFPAQNAHNRRAVPIRWLSREGHRGEVLVAFDTPPAVDVVDELSFVLDARITACVAPEDVIDDCLDRLYPMPKPASYRMVDLHPEVAPGGADRSSETVLRDCRADIEVHPDGCVLMVDEEQWRGITSRRPVTAFVIEYVRRHHDPSGQLTVRGQRQRHLLAHFTGIGRPVAATREPPGLAAGQLDPTFRARIHGAAPAPSSSSSWPAAPRSTPEMQSRLPNGAGHPPTPAPVTAMDPRRPVVPGQQLDPRRAHEAQYPHSRDLPRPGMPPSRDLPSARPVASSRDLPAAHPRGATRDVPVMRPPVSGIPQAPAGYSRDLPPAASPVSRDLGPRPSRPSVDLHPARVASTDLPPARPAPSSTEVPVARPPTADRGGRVPGVAVVAGTPMNRRQDPLRGSFEEPTRRPAPPAPRREAVKVTPVEAPPAAPEVTTAGRASNGHAAPARPVVPPAPKIELPSFPPPPTSILAAEPDGLQGSLQKALSVDEDVDILEAVEEVVDDALIVDSQEVAPVAPLAAAEPDIQFEPAVESQDLGDEPLALDGAPPEPGRAPALEAEAPVVEAPTAADAPEPSDPVVVSEAADAPEPGDAEAVAEVADASEPSAPEAAASAPVEGPAPAEALVDVPSPSESAPAPLAEAVPSPSVAESAPAPSEPAPDAAQGSELVAADADASTDGAAAEAEAAAAEAAPVSGAIEPEPTPSEVEPSPAPTASEAPPAPADAAPSPRVLDTAGLEAAKTPVEVADALVDALSDRFAAVLVLVVKHDSALGWRGRADAVDRDLIESILVPLTEPSVFARAKSRAHVVVEQPDAAEEDVHKRLWRALKLDAPAQVAAAPVVLKDRVVNLIYVHPRSGERFPSDVVDDLDAASKAASAAFARLIKARKSG